jgi:hypothetical protein
MADCGLEGTMKQGCIATTINICTDTAWDKLGQQGPQLKEPMHRKPCAVLNVLKKMVADY